VGASFSFILQGAALPEEIIQNNEAKLTNYTKFVYETLKKRYNTPITKEEFVRYFKEHFVVTGNTSVNSIFRILTTDPMGGGKGGAGEENEDGEGGADGEGNNESAGEIKDGGRSGTPNRERSANKKGNRK
jgi:hypothetical protein